MNDLVLTNETKIKRILTQEKHIDAILLNYFIDDQRCNMLSKHVILKKSKYSKFVLDLSYICIEEINTWLPIAALFASDGTENTQAANNAPSSEYPTTTPEHPCYLAGNIDNTIRSRLENHGELRNKWVGTGHLKTDDKLRQADGTLGKVRYVNTITQTRTMYNSVQEAHTFFVDDPHTFFVGSHSRLAHNCEYKVDLKAMESHTNGKYKNAKGEDKSQFFYRLDANKIVKDAAKYADENDLWSNSKAKVPVVDGVIGVLARTGETTAYINVYRKSMKDGTYKIHGAPGTPR